MSRGDGGRLRSGWSVQRSTGGSLTADMSPHGGVRGEVSERRECANCEMRATDGSLFPSAATRRTDHQDEGADDLMPTIALNDVPFNSGIKLVMRCPKGVGLWRWLRPSSGKRGYWGLGDVPETGILYGGRQPDRGRPAAARGRGIDEGWSSTRGKSNTK